MDLSINSNIELKKRELRKYLKERLVNLSKSYRHEADRLIYQNLISLQTYQEAKCVFCYVGRDDEINTLPILEDVLARGVKLVVPKCVAKGIIVACEIHDLDQLQMGRYGIYEPKEQVETPADNIDLAIIPCISASRDGSRLGYGGGYYDRYLAESNFLKIVLCYEELTYDDIPMDTHDCKMDMLITENSGVDLGGR